MNGNILESIRRDQIKGTRILAITNNFSYTGNQLTSVHDASSFPVSLDPDYLYDAAGRMTLDRRNDLAIGYNDMNLVRKVVRNGATLANYSYLADGTKVSALDSLGNGLLYLGSMVFNKTSDGTQLESIAWDGGRIVSEPDGWGGTNLVPYLYSTDHLGSIRAVRNALTGEVVSRSDYEPYGTQTTLSGEPQRYRYNGKEDQSFAGTPYLDYGARQYDPAIGRWMAPDPLAEKSYSIGPYVFCAGNSINIIDPEGRDTVLVMDCATRPLDRGIRGTSYTASIYVIKDGVISREYRGSSYPNSNSNTDNRTKYNTLKEGEMPYNNLFGHKGSSVKGLNIVDEKGERYASAFDSNGNDVTAQYINVHSGKSDNGNYNSRGSHGCITIHPEDAEDFFSNFKWTNDKKTTGTSSGILILIRNNDARTKYEEELGIH